MVNPLNDEHREHLNRVLESIPITRELVEKCERCGLDVSAAKEQLEMQEQTARNLKREFFPNHP